VLRQPALNSRVAARAASGARGTIGILKRGFAKSSKDTLTGEFPTPGAVIWRTESSPAYYDLGIQAQAQAAWTEWFSPYFELMALCPEIKWFHYVNYDWTQGSYYASQGWKNNDLSVAVALMPLYTAELAKPKYLHSGEKNLLKDYEKYP